MAMESHSFIAGALDFRLVALPTVFIAYIAFKAFEGRRRPAGVPYPPGPRPLPIIGNLLDIPLEYAWKNYAEWAKTYGDTISLTFLGQVIVILNSPKAARDLLDKRSATYSARPPVPFYDLMGWGWFVPTAQYDDVWRAKRKVLDFGLRPNVAIQYQPMQRAKARDFLKTLASSPENFREHIEHFQGAIVMSTVYDYDVKAHGDRYLEAAIEMSKLGARTVMPGAVLVNHLPMLRHLPEWLPGTGFKKLARYGRSLGEEVRDTPFEYVKNRMRSGTARPSITLVNLQELEDIDSPDSEEALRLIAAATGSLYPGIASADTTVSAMTSFFLMLVLYPDVQKKAQAELDAVTGRTRLPDFSDRARLPYTEAICKELIRCRVVTPLGAPHAATQDDVYNGYFIPKGALVVANSWAMLHDPDVYPDPETFQPERYLTKDGQVKADPTLSVAFGFGKRACPGRHLVDTTLFIVVSSVLSVFTVGKAKDDQGDEIPVDSMPTGALVSHPKPFKCSITPRDTKAEQLIAGVQPD
ncbi:cytochrome P450 [Artomyces pyxidatus]|uniref:Cytochrome P450 n=1 Tax=Artomyces pyxidatus TaxID=48021 RepID=A0ACB8TLM8_9AGAM|nr:cytochrome P450 [Artomyces pyxidatus]